MKKTLLVIVMLDSLLVQAQGLTASLQKGDDMIPFQGVNAFRLAYEAADSGSIITLSQGLFNPVETIDKSVTIVGTGAFEGHFTRVSGMSITANYVKIEGIYFSGTVSLGEIRNCHIKKCYVQTLSSTASHTNTNINQCRIASDAAIATGINYSIRNSVVDGFGKNNTSENMAYIINCSILSGGAYPYAIYRNCYIAYYGSLPAPNEYYYNSFKSNVTYSPGCKNSNNKVATPTNSDYFDPAGLGTGEDGTPIGPQGGSGRSPYPSIPRIVSKTISSNTDAEGNLSVSLEVKAER